MNRVSRFSSNEEQVWEFLIIPMKDLKIGFTCSCGKEEKKKVWNEKTGLQKICESSIKF